MDKNILMTSATLFALRTAFRSVMFSGFFGLVLYAKNEAFELIVQKTLAIAAVFFIYIISTNIIEKNLSKLHWLIEAVAWSITFSVFWMSVFRLVQLTEEEAFFHLKSISYFGFVFLFSMGILGKYHSRREKNKPAPDAENTKLSSIFVEFRKNFRI